MSSIQVVALGAGQDVGRSCIIVTINNKRIMFDCGMHMGYSDRRKFPNFDFIAREGQFDAAIDAVIISHFHLDHCGALPYFSEVCGYTGPIIMTTPTKAICPILLRDYRKIQVERHGDTNFFTAAMIEQCMARVTTVNVHETIEVNGDPEFTVKAYYAGHVLGAAMFCVRVGHQSVVYTGDYNMTPDRHLGGTWIDDEIRPDLLITESTYATYVRDSKRSREQLFLKRCKECVEAGGKVLVPVFALGRVQELCILIDQYWTRMGLKVPIFFAQGLASRANEYYRLFVNWTNQALKQSFVQHNKFDFQNIRPFDRAYLQRSEPMVVFATPGMLHAGLSLELFKLWCDDPKNLVVMPGYCVAGTVGAKVLAGEKRIEVDTNTTLNVQCQIAHLSFSAHVDAKGIIQLVRKLQPRNVMLVHGEATKMPILSERIVSEFPAIRCFYPANGTVLNIPQSTEIPIQLSRRLLERSVLEAAMTTTAGAGAGSSSSSLSEAASAKRTKVGDETKVDDDDDDNNDLIGGPVNNVVVDGVLVCDDGANNGTSSGRWHLMDDQEEVYESLGLVPHLIECVSVFKLAHQPTIETLCNALTTHVSMCPFEYNPDAYNGRVILTATTSQIYIEIIHDNDDDDDDDDAYVLELQWNLAHNLVALQVEQALHQIVRSDAYYQPPPPLPPPPEDS